MKNLRFSIITVCYNSGNTIERTIRSVITQNYPPYEYIIIDGNSSDNTLNIINKYVNKVPSLIKFKSERDEGIYDAMNKGLKMVTGDIVGIVNSDDWLEPDALHSVYDAYIRNGHSTDSIYVGWMNFHYDKNDCQILRASSKKFVKKAKVYQMAGINHPATFVSKSIYDKVGLFDARMAISADADFILRCYFEKIPFYYINKVLTNMSSNGVSNSGGWKLTKKAFNDRKIILDKYITNPFAYIYYQGLWIMKVIIKPLMPSFILKLVRK